MRDRPDIRRASPDDAAAIRAVQAETWIATYGNETLGITQDALRRHIEGDAGEKIADRTARIRRRIESETGESTTVQDFVAVLDGEVVGYTTPFIESGGRRRVGALYVRPSAQGMGIGHHLLERNLAWHGEDQDVYLNVVSYNEHARRFYERHGFAPTGEIGHDAMATLDGVVIPEVEMVRRARP